MRLTLFWPSSLSASPQAAIRPAPDSPRIGGMASDGDLLLAAFEAGRAAVFKALSELAEPRSKSEPGWP